MTEDNWREKLTHEEYRICREKGTERPFSGEFCEHKAAGIYICKCCDAELFDSETKFDSGSGWPSFYQSLTDEAVSEEVDTSMCMSRVEIKCHQCGCHLGHVFEDGPEITGRRYCVNSASLNFKDK